MGIAFDLTGLRLLPAGIVADAARELGVEVWAAAYAINLARSLAEAVDHVVDLTVGHALAA